MIGLLERLGHATRTSIVSIGYATRMFFTILRASGGLWRRLRLITDQIHFIGNYSLVIIAISGLFVASSGRSSTNRMSSTAFG